MIIHVSTKSADSWAGDTLGEINLHQHCGIDPVVVNKLIIDTRTKFCIYARRAFRLQKTQ